VKDETDVSAV